MMRGIAVLQAKARNRSLRRAALLVALTLAGTTMVTFAPAATAETAQRVGIA